jgi:hypothetical protein
MYPERKLRRAYGLSVTYVCHSDSPHRKTIYERREPRMVLLVAAIALFLFSSLNMPGLLGYSSTLAETLLISLSFGALVLGTGFAYQYCGRKNIIKFKESHQSHKLIQVREDNVEDLQNTATSSIFSVAQARIFAFSVVKPRQFRQRVDESYELDQRTVRQRVSLEVQIPRSLLNVRDQSLLQEIIYFPVLMPNKSKFFDDFCVTDESGKSLSVLTYREDYAKP